MKIRITEITEIEADARELRKSNTLADKFCNLLNRCLQSSEPFDDDTVSKMIGIDAHKGHWTKDNACSICGFKPWYEEDIHTLSYCPNCGAKMTNENSN